MNMQTRLVLNSVFMMVKVVSVLGKDSNVFICLEYEKFVGATTTLGKWQMTKNMRRWWR